MPVHQWYTAGGVLRRHLRNRFERQQWPSAAPDSRQISSPWFCHPTQNICLPLPVCQTELPLPPQCPPPLSRFASLQRPFRPGTPPWATATITPIGRGPGGVPGADAAPVARASTAAPVLRRCAGSLVPFSFCGMRVGCLGSVMAGAPCRRLATTGPYSGRRLPSYLCSV